MADARTALQAMHRKIAMNATLHVLVTVELAVQMVTIALVHLVLQKDPTVSLALMAANAHQAIVSMAYAAARAAAAALSAPGTQRGHTPEHATAGRAIIHQQTAALASTVQVVHA